MISPQKQQKRKEIEQYFRGVAQQENAKNQKIEFEDLLDKNDNKRVLIVQKESLGDIFLITSLLESIRNRYPFPDYTIYFATQKQNFPLLDGNHFIDKVLEYQPFMESLLQMEGFGGHKGFFEIVYLPFVGTQRFLSYLHNGNDQIDLKLS